MRRTYLTSKAVWERMLSSRLRLLSSKIETVSEWIVNIFDCSTWSTTCRKLRCRRLNTQEIEYLSIGQKRASERPSSQHVLSGVPDWGTKPCYWHFSIWIWTWNAGWKVFIERTETCKKQEQNISAGQKFHTHRMWNRYQYLTAKLIYNWIILK